MTPSSKFTTFTTITSSGLPPGRWPGGLLLHLRAQLHGTLIIGHSTFVGTQATNDVTTHLIPYGGLGVRAQLEIFVTTFHFAVERVVENHATETLWCCKRFQLSAVYCCSSLECFVVAILVG